MLAVIITIVIVITLATAVVITLSGDNDQARIETVADRLHRIAAELDTTQAASGQSFIAQVGIYPLHLSHLYTKITSADSQCKYKSYGGGNVGSWRGPYHLVPIATTGHQLGPGFFADDTISYFNKTDLQIVMRNVALEDAKALELFVEKKSDGSGPVVTYSPTTGSSPVTVKYHITVSGC